MRALTCRAARRLLQAYHDGELSFADQIAVGSHVDACDGCAEAMADLRALSGAIRVLAPSRHACALEDEHGFEDGVVARLRAENAVALTIARLRDVFDDMHFVYAGFAAAGAALVCLAVALSTFQSATMHSPGSDLNPVPIDASVLMPRPLEPIAPMTLSDDAVFTLAGVVTRDGRVTNLELLRAIAGEPASLEGEAGIERVMGAMALARFEPARLGGLPVAVNMVWVVARTTVRGDAPVRRRKAGKRPVTTRVHRAAPGAAPA